MIDYLRISNLKSIDKIILDCSNYNLLIGTNSSGKSTILQSLLILSQNIDDNFGINGPLVSLGDFRELKNFNVSKKEIEICAKMKGEIIEFKMMDDGVFTKLIPDNTNLNPLNYKKGNLHYLSCNRIGSKDTYQKNIIRSDNFGIEGEYSINYLMEHGSDKLEADLIKSKEMMTLTYQVNYWLKYIINANIQVENIIGTDVVKAMYSVVEGKYTRPRNVGSGISFLISIITMCLGSKKGDILLIENPEIHLNPMSQSRLSEFFYFISCSGRQLFVETHSDHLFNGIRVGIGTKKMENSKISINFIKLNENFCSTNHIVEIGPRGKILNPTDYLFDQFELDLDKMLGI